MFRFFWIGVTIRIIIMIAACLHFAFAVVQVQSLNTPIVPISVAIILFSVYNLIKYIERNNRQLANLVLSIKEREFNQNVIETLNTKGARELTPAFQAILHEFRQLNLEKESTFRLLSVLNENLQVGVIISNNGGKIKSVNSYAKRVLGVANLLHLNDLQHIDQAFYNQLMNLSSGERKIFRHNKIDKMEILIDKTSVKMTEELIDIFMIYNISNELEEKEFAAWQEVTNVLTHEIMNSVTPILSLTQAVDRILTNRDGSRKDIRDLDQKSVDNIYLSLETAMKRGVGLIEFVKKYRDFAVTPQIYVEPFDIAQSLREALRTVEAQYTNRAVDLYFTSPPSFLVNADKHLLEQVFINVIRNAYESLVHDRAGKIEISLTRIMNDKTMIKIADNGIGIDEEASDKIFLPFYTTKEDGSGIGLSLAKQIVRLHHGSIQVKSQRDIGTSVIITL